MRVGNQVWSVSSYSEIVCRVKVVRKFVWKSKVWSFRCQPDSSSVVLTLAGNGFGLRAGGHFEAQNCQFTIKFISCSTFQITTIRPLAFSPCYQLGVLVCQWFEIIFQFSHSVFSVLKDLVFLVSANLALADRQAL